MDHRSCINHKSCIYSYLLFFFSAGSNVIAFTAIASNSRSYSSGSTIQFNQLKINLGNGFNTGNYRFTAPIGGVYVFSWSLSLNSNYRGNSYLKKNGSNYHSLNCEKTYQQCGATVAMPLKKGEQVWVTSATTIYAYGTHSSFSGWKIN